MSELIITSPSNARLKSLVALRRRRAREEAGLTLLEGYDELSLALDAGLVPRVVYYCPELMLDPSVQQDPVQRAHAPRRDTRQLGRGGFGEDADHGSRGGVLAAARPGVRAHGNARLSAAGVNTAAQYLSTNEEVGYVVIDVDGATGLPALGELCAVPATIRCRILY